MSDGRTLPQVWPTQAMTLLAHSWTYILAKLTQQAAWKYSALPWFQSLPPDLPLAVIYQEVTHHTWPLFAPLNLGNPGKPISPYLLPLHSWPHRKYRSNNPLGRGPTSLFRAHVSLYHGMLVGVMLCCYTSGELLYNCHPHNLPQKPYRYTFLQ